jgi:hypothetical protein
VPEGRERFGALHHAGQQRRLGQVQLLRRLAEIEPGRRFQTIPTMTHVDLVAVQLEDLVFGERPLDLHRQHRLAELPAEALFTLQKEAARELHAESARAL